MTGSPTLRGDDAGPWPIAKYLDRLCSPNGSPARVICVRLRPTTGIWLIRFALLLCAMAIGLTPGNAKPYDSDRGRRLALVIGNSHYKAIAPVKSAVGDAQLMADALRQLGFNVKFLSNASIGKINAAIAQLAKGARSDDHVVLYYAGQGFRLGGVNYIVPTDAVLTSADVIEARTIKLDDAIARLQANGRQTMVFIDASHADPLPPDVRETQPIDGLAELQGAMGANLFVAFAAGPGEVSRDGIGGHSPFAAALARLLFQPDLPIYQVLRAVQSEVLAGTGGAQSPTVEESLTEPFYFSGELPAGLQFGEEGAGATTSPPVAADP